MPPRKTKSTTKVVAKNNPFRLTHIPLLSWVAFWVCISATLVLISATFTSALSFAQTPKENADTVAALQQLGDALEKKADEITKPACALDGLTWNKDAANTTVSYTEATSSVKMTLPYNFSWGDGKNPLYPYVLENNAVHFGPAQKGLECNVVRDSMLSVRKEKLTPNAIRQNLTPGYPGVSEDMTASIRERTVNGIQVLSFKADGDRMAWYAFGKSYTYILFSAGWLTDAEAVKIIQSLRVEK